ncbi:Hercynine oxygenase [Candidatus Magnetaquicoccaceae bacterium FCR-1]|uniref:Hercynine oxygenase n=1 Tax=Candidatus Magnetaquiglobus chichijimensis TaxID=3141448 RepID=A0ABQ0CAM4_9PROT
MIHEETARIILKNCWPKYRLDGLIDAGAYGTVYRVRSEELERVVKFVTFTMKRDNRAGATAAGELWLREWNSLQQRYQALQCDEIVAVYDFNRDQVTSHGDGRIASGFGAILMAYYPSNLNSYLEDHPRLPAERKRQIVVRLAEILERLYSLRHHLYTDLKPENILLREQAGASVPKMVLGDIGGLKSIHTIAGGSFEVSDAYRAPEVVPGKPFPSASVGLRATLWSFGMVAFQVLQGRLPHQAAYSTSEAIRDHGLDWDREAIDGLGRVVEAVEQCLRFDPAQRPEDFAQVLQLLQGRPAVPTAMPVVAQRPAESLVRPASPPPFPPIQPLPRLGDEWCCPVTGMVFVWVPGGVFQMGDLFGEGSSDEKPVHEVSLDGFWIGKYPVTQGEWVKVMGHNPSYFQKGARYPVEQVSWNDAQSMIEKLNTQVDGKWRLPTEAEWEYACRSGGKRERYSGGDDIERVAWYRGNSGDSIHPVGEKAPNGLGLHDMSGNVWEWVSDWYDTDYYAYSPRENPQGPSGRSYRVIRGGGWNTGPARVRSALRSRLTPDFRHSSLGFRLARTGS